MILGASCFWPLLAFYPRSREVGDFYTETPEMGVYVGSKTSVLSLGWQRIRKLEGAFYVARYTKYSQDVGFGVGILAESKLHYFGFDVSLSYRGRASFLQVSPRVSLKYFPFLKYPGYFTPVDRVDRNFAVLTFGVDLGMGAKVEVIK